ncbi:MAG TPA: hypothetical protein DDW98_10500, partial [Gammaproteobacteria bacterium]|nr:hypothetical protein [Gammaproteobacteria bacterium]
GPDDGSYVDINVPEKTSEEISYHVQLLHEAGLLKAQDYSSIGDYDWKPLTLTWEGHEFLDAARNETLWNRAKSIALEKTGGLGFEALKFALTESIKGLLS